MAKMFGGAIGNLGVGKKRTRSIDDVIDQSVRGVKTNKKNQGTVKRSNSK